ncbi:putative prophage phiRv2 integrase [bacterium BMS3Abin02]|nr:putative prophage phiRv2 integrase [bacterium BMS3Abin02]GBE21694.1 putative prophage phiRv2 integrase [bacterium BMS3Bbin01]HDH25729.1 site-specific integrase [Actinomycetota bacterium]HDL48922.1 site-specific integrase [Actinomycetota bacterium]
MLTDARSYNPTVSHTHKYKRDPTKSASRNNISWRAVWKDPAGQRQTKAGFPTKAAADRFLEHVTADLVSGSYTDPRRALTTFGRLAERWFRTLRDKSPNTIAGYRSLLDVHVLPRWGVVPLGDIDNLGLSEWLAELPLSLSRRRQAFRVVTAVLRLAIRNSYIAKNPAEGITLPEPPKRDRYLTPFEVARLADALTPVYDALVLVMAFGGLRWGEAVALRRRDIDIQRGRLMVSRSLVEKPGGGFMFKGTKTDRARTAAVPPGVVDRLVRHLSGISDDPEDLVFTSREGRPLRRSNFNRRYWKPALDVAGLENVTPHDLRHTSVAFLIAAGAPALQIQIHAGHSSAKVTLDRYGHLFPDAFDTTRGLLENLYREGTAELEAR